MRTPRPTFYSAVPAVPGAQESQTLFEVLSLVLFFYAYTVERSGAWVDNGNTADDHKRWTERIDAIVQDLDVEALSDELGVAPALLERVRALHLEDTVENSNLKAEGKKYK